MKNLMRKAWIKSKEKKSGFDGLIVTIGLILLVMILIFVFKTTVATQVNKSITSVSSEISSISDWNTDVDLDD